MLEPQPKENFSLEEIAAYLFENKLLPARPEKGEEAILKELREGKLVVAIMSTGAIKYPSHNTSAFLEFDKGKVKDYKIGVAFFSAYVPVIENDQITRYERVK